MAYFFLAFYQFLAILFGPLLKLFLKLRVKKGKEIAERLSERYGYSSLKRKSGKLVWFHSASVGETVLLLPFLENLFHESISFVVTTGTASAAQILKKKFPQACHQFVPLDHPIWVKRFLDFWRPSIVIWTESEFWPTILHALKRRHIPVILLNGGISENSLKKWRWAWDLLKSTLKCFTKIYSRSVVQTQRLKNAGLNSIDSIEGNIKFLSAPLEVDPVTSKKISKELNSRPIWLAASTHSALSSLDNSEETKIFIIHRLLKEKIPNLLTIVAPRHPHRREQILQEWGDPTTLACRSLQQPITCKTEIYLVDTLGELGTFFQLSPVSFIGGSLVPQGGHNLLEPIQLGSVPLSGPYIDNSKEVVKVLNEPWIIAHSVEDLSQKIFILLTDSDFRQQLHTQLNQNVQQQQQQLLSIFNSVKTLIHRVYYD